MDCTNCGRGIPDWAADNYTVQGLCLNCLVPCKKCETLLPQDMAEIRDGLCMNCDIQGDEPNPAIVCGTCHCYVDDINSIQIIEGEVSYWCPNCGDEPQTE